MGRPALPYRLIGFGTAKIILIHGLGAEGSDWQLPQILNALECFDATYAAIDLPGHGWARQRVSQRDFADLAEDISAVATELRWAEFGLVGYSFGALAAVHVAGTDERVAWAVVGGLTSDLWDTNTRSRRAELLMAEISSAETAKDDTCNFLRQRGCRIDDIRALMHLPCSKPESLSNTRCSRTVLASSHEWEDAQAWAKTFGWVAPIATLRGDHTSAFLSGAFAEEAIRLAPERALLHSAGVIVRLAGPPGVGKTSVASEALRGGGVHISADIIRHELFSERTYSSDESRAVYAECTNRAITSALEGQPVIFDATNMGSGGAHVGSSSVEQRIFIAGVPTAVVGLHAPSGTILRRVEQRQLNPRHPQDKSEAGLDVATRFLAYPRHAHELDLDTSLWAPEEAGALVRAILGRSVRPSLSREYLRAHDMFQRAARELRSGGGWPIETERIAALLAQIRTDAENQIFARWGRSTVVDDNVGLPVVPVEILDRFAHEAHQERGDWVLNAGLAHTYCYLFSDLLTPYGWKRDRWLDGRLAAAAGCDSRLLSPYPPEGTLLGNFTRLLNSFLQAEAATGSDNGMTFEAKRLSETDPASGITLETRLYRRQGEHPQDGATTLLIYSRLNADGDRKLITAFPVDQSYATSRFVSAAADEGPLIARYNAVVEGLSDAPSRRILEDLEAVSVKHEFVSR